MKRGSDEDGAAWARRMRKRLNEILAHQQKLESERREIINEVWGLPEPVFSAEFSPESFRQRPGADTGVDWRQFHPMLTSFTAASGNHSSGSSATHPSASSAQGQLPAASSASSAEGQLPAASSASSAQGQLPAASSAGSAQRQQLGASSASSAQGQLHAASSASSAQGQLPGAASSASSAQGQLPRVASSASSAQGQASASSVQGKPVANIDRTPAQEGQPAATPSASSYDAQVLPGSGNSNACTVHTHTGETAANAGPMPVVGMHVQSAAASVSVAQEREPATHPSACSSAAPAPHGDTDARSETTQPTVPTSSFCDSRTQFPGHVTNSPIVSPLLGSATALWSVSPCGAPSPPRTPAHSHVPPKAECDPRSAGSTAAPESDAPRRFPLSHGNVPVGAAPHVALGSRSGGPNEGGPSPPTGVDARVGYTDGENRPVNYAKASPTAQMSLVQRLQQKMRGPSPTAAAPSTASRQAPPLSCPPIEHTHPAKAVKAEDPPAEPKPAGRLGPTAILDLSDTEDTEDSGTCPASGVPAPTEPSSLTETQVPSASSACSPGASVSPVRSTSPRPSALTAPETCSGPGTSDANPARCNLDTSDPTAPGARTNPDSAAPTAIRTGPDAPPADGIQENVVTPRNASGKTQWKCVTPLMIDSSDDDNTPLAQRRTPAWSPSGFISADALSPWASQNWANQSPAESVASRTPGSKATKAPNLTLPHLSLEFFQGLDSAGIKQWMRYFGMKSNGSEPFMRNRLAENCIYLQTGVMPIAEVRTDRRRKNSGDELQVINAIRQTSFFEEIVTFNPVDVNELQAHLREADVRIDLKSLRDLLEAKGATIKITSK